MRTFHKDRINPVSITCRYQVVMKKLWAPCRHPRQLTLKAPSPVVEALASGFQPDWMGWLRGFTYCNFWSLGVTSCKIWHQLWPQIGLNYWPNEIFDFNFSSGNQRPALAGWILWHEHGKKSEYPASNETSDHDGHDCCDSDDTNSSSNLLI